MRGSRGTREIDLAFLESSGPVLAADRLAPAASRSKTSRFQAPPPGGVGESPALGNYHVLKLHQDHWCGRWDADPGAKSRCGVVWGGERHAQAGCKVLIWTGYQVVGTLLLGLLWPKACFWLARFSFKDTLLGQIYVFFKNHLLASF